MASDRRRWPRLAALLVAWFGTLGVAEAADEEEPEVGIQVVVPSGRLQPGRSSTILVAVARGDETSDEVPHVEVSSGTLRYEGLAGRGIWAYRYQPAATDPPHAVDLAVSATGAAWSVRLPVAPPPPSRLRLPERIEAHTSDATSGGEVRFRVTGDELPPPEALAVIVGEGRVLGVEPVSGALEVRVAVDDIPFPRIIPVGVRDRRREERPAWSWIRLRARPFIPLQSEPGATVALTVGGRGYGPYVADEAGAISAWVDQWPGDLVASAVFTDDLGNETRTELPLAANTQPVLVAFPASQVVPGEPPPLVFLHAVSADGSRWTGPPPTCRTPAVDLPVHPVGPGQWMVALPELDGEPEDVRAECALVRGRPATFRVPVADDVPARLRMRVWPTELRSDFPVAEVRVVLEDARGERLPVDGVRVRARHGDVVMEQPQGATVGRGEYVGDPAVEPGEDRITAVYDPPGRGAWVQRLGLGWDAVPGPSAERRWRVHARAQDIRRRPVVGATVELSAGADVVAAVTDGDGWASAEVALPDGHDPVVLSARHDGWVAQHPVIRGQRAAGGPGQADLVDIRDVTISPGRVAGVSIDVEPPILRSAPGAVAWVRVRLEDRGGSAVTDERVVLEASEGRVGALRQRPDGSFVAEYVPLGVERGREVTLTARTETVRSSATLRVEPRVVHVSLGPWVGVQSNLGGVTAPVVGLDADIRIRSRWFGESAMLRLGAATYTFSRVAETQIGEPARVQSSVAPLSAALLIRQDVGGVGVFGGAGGSVALHRMDLRFGDALVARGSTVHAGPLLIGGVARRALGGELVAQLRSSWLHSSGGEFGYTGNIGGLAVGLGYRVVF